MIDVLVFTPVYRLEPETVKAIFSLEWDGALTVLFQRDNPTDDGVKNHLHQYQRARRLFLDGTYTHMLVIESDIEPPQNTIERLVSVDADVAYGCYYFRPNGAVNILEKYRKPAQNLGESLSERGLWEEAKRQGIVECSGSGLGCTLIRRNVLETVPFEASDGGGFFDYDWTAQVYRQGFKMIADTSVSCVHIRPEGIVDAP